MCKSNADRLKVIIVNSFRAGVFTRQEMKELWQRAYPESPFDHHLIMSDYCVNTISGYPTFPEKDRFLFSLERGKYRMYNPDSDGHWKRIGDRMVKV